MRKIGYARVSSSAQNLDRQIGALRAERCHEVYREKASGKAIKGRPQLEKAIDALGTGDVLVVAEWDRATRSMMDGVHIIERIHARGAMIRVLDKPHLDLATPIGRGFIAFLSALAEDERQLVTATTHVDILRRLRNTRPTDLVRKINAAIVSQARLYVYSTDRTQDQFISNRMSSRMQEPPFFPSLVRPANPQNWEAGSRQ